MQTPSPPPTPPSQFPPSSPASATDSFLNSSPLDQGWAVEENNWNAMGVLNHLNDDQRLERLIRNAYISPFDLPVNYGAEEPQEYMMSGALDAEDGRCTVADEECQIKHMARLVEEYERRQAAEAMERQAMEAEQEDSSGEEGSDRAS